MLEVWQELLWFKPLSLSELHCLIIQVIIQCDRLEMALVHYQKYSVHAFLGSLTWKFWWITFFFFFSTCIDVFDSWKPNILKDPTNWVESMAFFHSVEEEKKFRGELQDVHKWLPKVLEKGISIKFSLQMVQFRSGCEFYHCVLIKSFSTSALVKYFRSIC